MADEGERLRVATALPAYEVGSVLGRGGHGIVFEGVHRTLARQVAIKVLPPAFAYDAEIRGRFGNEARLLAGFDHPHIVPVYDYVEQEGLCVLVMERLTGGTVADSLQTGVRADAACAITIAVCSALQYAHERGALHRDIKPSNIVFNAGRVPKVTDFGIAKILDAADRVTRAGELLGTPAYMAPEQATGGAVTPATDVYATGIVLYEMLSGQMPFPKQDTLAALLVWRATDSPRPLVEVAPAVPAAVAEATMRALAREPGERWRTPDEFGQALAGAAAAAWGPAWVASSGVSVRSAAMAAFAPPPGTPPPGAPPAAAPPAPAPPPAPSPASSGPSRPPGPQPRRPGDPRRPPVPPPPPSPAPPPVPSSPQPSSPQPSGPRPPVPTPPTAPPGGPSRDAPATVIFSTTPPPPPPPPPGPPEPATPPNPKRRRNLIAVAVVVAVLVAGTVVVLVTTGGKNNSATQTTVAGPSTSGATSSSAPPPPSSPPSSSASPSPSPPTSESPSPQATATPPPPGTIETFAGNGDDGQLHENCQGEAPQDARFFRAENLATSADGTVFIADTRNNRVCQVKDGVVTVLAGDGEARFAGDGGPAVDASFNFPQGVAVDSSGAVWVADNHNDRVRRVDPDGHVSTVAGPHKDARPADGCGPPDLSGIYRPYGIAVSPSGDVFVADACNQVIRRINAAGTTIVAGNGVAGFSGDGGPADKASLQTPTGLAIDGAGNIYIADKDNHRIRMVSAADHTISTIVGTGVNGRTGGDGGPALAAQLTRPQGVAVDRAGNVFVADTANHRVLERTVDGRLFTAAGTGDGGFDGDGAAAGKKVKEPIGLAIDFADRLFVADWGNDRIRLITFPH